MGGRAVLDKGMLDARRRSLLVGVVSLLLLAGGAVTNFEAFASSYLLAFVYWIGVPLSCLAFLMLHNLVGGRWSFLIRRPLEAGTRTLILFVPLFLPLVAVLLWSDLWHWSHYVVGTGDSILDHKAAYLNAPFFLIRVGFYFAIWLLLAGLLNRWSARQAAGEEGPWAQRMTALSGPGILLYFVTVTLASVDWIMSLDSHWFSTVFSLIYIVGEALLTMAVMILVLERLSRHEPLKGIAVKERFHELGNFLLAFVMLWAYMSVSQLLIIWSADLPEENPWYLLRFSDPWSFLGIALLLFHFVVPFLLLLWRTNKTRPGALGRIAVALMIVRWIDLFWLSKPSIDPQAEHVFGLTSLGMDLLAWLGLGGVWVSFYLYRLGQRDLLAVNDPRLPREFGGLSGEAAVEHV